MYDVAVIGLGAMGASTCWHLASRGVRVLGIDQFTPPHDHGSSHGLSRAIRTAYFEDPCYVPLVQEAVRQWRRLEQEADADLLDMMGVLLVGPELGELIAGARRSCRQHSLPHELLSREDITRRWPVFSPPHDDVGLYEQAGGYLRPEAAISAFLQVAERQGATLRYGERITAITRDGDDMIVTTGDGSYKAGHIVIAAGAWIGGLVPELSRLVRTTRQVLAWFDPVDPALVAPQNMPVFAMETGAGAFYGFPMLDGEGVKIAKHGHQREPVDADGVRRQGEAADEALLRVFADHYMPDSLGPLRKMATCIYTELPQDFFLIDHLPANEHVSVVSACSGHGFKFASVLGGIAADLATSGSTAHDIASFSFAALMQRAGQ